MESEEEAWRGGVAAGRDINVRGLAGSERVCEGARVHVLVKVRGGERALWEVGEDGERTIQEEALI